MATFAAVGVVAVVLGLHYPEVAYTAACQALMWVAACGVFLVYKWAILGVVAGVKALRGRKAEAS